MWLGVTPLGINIYGKDNKLIVKTTFQWSEIQHVSYDEKKFIIKHVGNISPYFVFYTHKIEINKLVIVKLLSLTKKKFLFYLQFFRFWIYVLEIMTFL